MSRIEEIRARERAATPGPWIYEKDWSDGENVGFDLRQARTGRPILDVSLEHAYDISASEEDAEFIAHAREDVPWLRDMLKEEISRRYQAECSYDHWKARAEALEAWKDRLRDIAIGGIESSGDCDNPEIREVMVWHFKALLHLCEEAEAALEGRCGHE